MPGSTGPDNNTYTIPEVQLGDTFNFWRDATNTAIYKLNKLKIYDAVGSGSIGVTYGSTGAWSASLAPTITEGLTFTQTIVFSSGITAAGVYSSRGITAIAGIWTTGGLSADRLYVGGGSTFASNVSVGGGLSGSTIYASSGSTFASNVSVGGGLSASNIYASGGSTFAGILQVNGGATFASTTDHTGVARFSGGLSASSIYGGSVGSTFAGILYVGGGATFASTTDHTGAARFAGGLSASSIYGGSVGSTFASNVSVAGGLSASSIYAGSVGSTFAGILYVGGGATFASNIDVAGAAKFNGGATASTLQVTGNTTVGSTSTSATLGVCGSVLLFGQTPLRFADADSSHWVGFRAPAAITNNLAWTLPSVDGSAGQVLFTDGGGTLSWKAADGATGSDKYVQYNQGGVPGACAAFVFEYTSSAGVCAGTLGLSGGLYCNNNVAIGLSQGAATPRLYSASTAKLEVRGDIRIPNSGFFVNKGMTLPSSGITVAADENVFMAGTLVVPSGATLTVQTDGYIVIL